jgi:hypothetical protein|tara:strand:- start:2712 stop:3659 length:948 start_codon:yes stop_codon:yes gene_type:complete
MNNFSYNKLLEENFKEIIINNKRLKKIFDYGIRYDTNILLSSIYGMPLDLLVYEIIKEKYKIKKIIKKECIWDKTVIYNENLYFFEIDLMNPSIPKDYTFLTKFILNILKSKNILSRKHLIIIKHINLLREYFSILKILLENFSDNAYFICTTHNISSIEDPIKSRFINYRIPLFTNKEIQEIFKKYFKSDLNKYLIEDNNRNLIFAIFIAEIEKKEPKLITKEFCTLNFPPLYNFIKNFNKKTYNLDTIRNFSYNCFQYNVKLSDILSDILKIMSLKNKKDVIKTTANIEHTLILTNKGRELIYIETLLCKILL